MIDYETEYFEAGLLFSRQLNPRLNFTEAYTFYYDETNNIKTFYVRENDFNFTFDANFVLGGLVHQGAAPNVKPLIQSFRLQKTAREVKFKHIAFGDFPDCLKSDKLNLFFNFLEESTLYVHYTSLNILYWSIVDIVDSAIMNLPAALKLGPGFSNHLKNDLYKLCRLEIDSVRKLFYDFGYPNIKSDKIGQFIEELTSVFEPYLETEEFHIGLESLRQILKQSAKSGSLPFVMDEEDHLLLANLVDFYMKPIYVFRNSTHIFDNEDSIQQELQNYNILYQGSQIANYSFVDSQDSELTQLSDVFTGIMGKYTQYRNTHSFDEMVSDIENFSEMQLKNLSLFIKLIDKSDRKNPAFIYSTESYEEIVKFDKLRSLMKKLGDGR